MTIKIKVPVKKVEKSPDVKKVIEDTLKFDPEFAYTISGLMVEKFGFQKTDIDNKPFSRWPKGAPTMYSKIRNTLEKLKEEGKVKSAKDEKAMVYWWIKQ